MKGSLLVVILLSLLIVGILVMKNIGGSGEDEPSKVETVNQARDKADEAQQRIDEIQKHIQKTE